MIASFPLARLPEELISVIVSHLPTSADRVHLALASKQLHRIATEQLYRHISFRLGIEYKDYEFLYAFTILLLERPRLAAHVRHLTIRGKWAASWEARQARGLDELHPALRSAIDSLTQDRENKPEWADNIVEWEREEALVAVLVHSLPNLRTWDTNIPEQPGMHYQWLMGCVSGQEPTALQKLRELMLVIPDGAPRAEPGSFKPYFQLPALKRVFLCGIGAGSARNWNRGAVSVAVQANRAYLSKTLERRASTNTFLSPIEHLEIREGSFDFELICDLVTSCKQLKTFAYETNKYSQGLYTSLLSALAIHAGTLESLCLGYPTVAPRDCDVDVPHIQQFRQLQHLKASSSFLFAATASEQRNNAYSDNLKRKIPSGLKKLTIIQEYCMDGWTFTTAIHDLLLDQRNICPELNELSIFASSGLNTSQEIYKYLWQPSVEQQVRLRIYVPDSTRGPRVERPWGMDDDIHWADVDGLPHGCNRWLHNLEYVPAADDIVLVNFERFPFAQAVELVGRQL
ncbi:hypothetical protein BU26DRAFT_523712 [Trematosphaeria pertusa]|uniref:F-box domain-containing protein n=1 Tax=Trematosphaeria pertusa TaxID=390896 RepID=A0A6A6HYT6_9PLEO|nr:uncharacterized protein BU26DRAFT_523712 [Trematosphaeria pertusa]KAF2243394.1 hypothetical protein BU26DRAFT_523712 [Trematosphaeria pertusa]